MHADLRSAIRRSWIDTQVIENYQRILEKEHDRAAAELAQLSIVELTDELYQPGWFTRLLAGDTWRAQSSSETEIAAFEQTLGQSLPLDHRELLLGDVRRANLGILAPAELVTFGKVSDEYSEYLVMMMTEKLDEADAETIDQCWVVFGFIIETWEGDKSEIVVPRALWCPQLSPENQYYASDYSSFFPTLTDLVRSEVARLSLSY